MSGKRLLYNTAPKIKIRLGNSTMAYAVGFNVSVNVGLSTVNAVGNYAPIAIEPTLYNVVTGTLQIIKPVSSSITKKISDNRGGIGPYSSAVGEANVKQDIDYPAGTDESMMLYQGLSKHLNPKEVLTSETFDLDLYLRAPDPSDSSKIIDVPWFRISDCRIGSRSISISLGQLVGEPISFQGILFSPMTSGGLQVFAPDNRADK